MFTPCRSLLDPLGKYLDLFFGQTIAFWWHLLVFVMTFDASNQLACFDIACHDGAFT